MKYLSLTPALRRAVSSAVLAKPPNLETSNNRAIWTKLPGFGCGVVGWLRRSVCRRAPGLVSGALGQVSAVWAASQTIRCILYSRLARPILVVARARPMVRMNRPIGPFWRAKTCSTAARTADLRALARAVRRGIGLPRLRQAFAFCDGSVNAEGGRRGTSHWPLSGKRCRPRRRWQCCSGRSARAAARPSWRAASVTVQRRIRRCRRSMPR